MAPPSMSLIEDLRVKDIEKLTQLLVLSPLTDPHPVWLQEQANFIQTLPPKLKRAKTLFPRLTMAIPFRTQGAHLCPAHQSLNPYLIRRIFLQVSAECTARLTRLAKNRFLPANIAIHVKTLQMANSLWMSPELYRVTFQCQPEDKRYDRIASDCEACILATVGGNIQILKELRTSMLGREMKRKKRARLLPLVEAWIEWADAAGAIRADSDILAKEVRSCRRQMQEARRQKKRNLAEGIVESAAPDDNDMAAPLLSHNAAGQAFKHKEKDESPRHDHDHDHDHEDRGYDQDPEEAIIDFYSNHISSTWQTHDQDKSSIHPAFRDSIVPQFQTDPNVSSSTDASYGSLPPRPGSMAYPETGPGMNSGHGGASESAPAPASAAPTGAGRVRQPPPVSYHNRAYAKYMQNQVAKKRETGYTESVYSTDGGFGSGPSYIPPSQQSKSLTVWNPQTLQTVHQQQQQNQNSRWNTSAEEQAGESSGLSDVVENDAPRLWRWGDLDDGDEDEDTDGNGNGSGDVRRDTHVTSFGDFLRK